MTPLPSPLRYSPLNSQQKEWIRGQNQFDGAPTPPPISELRVTEDDQQRITEDGEDRVTE